MSEWVREGGKTKKGRKKERSGRITHCLCAVTALFTAQSQLQLICKPSVNMKARLPETQDWGFGFNYSLLLKMLQLFIMVILIFLCMCLWVCTRVFVRRRVCTLLWWAAGLLTSVLWESDIPIDLHLPWEVCVCLCVCVHVCAHLCFPLTAYCRAEFDLFLCNSATARGQIELQHSSLIQAHSRSFSGC